MRIAVSGAHRTGKTTLVAELAAMWPGFAVIDEPYYLLEHEGQLSADMPSVGDFEEQLERALRSLRESEGDCLFDRCPLDLLAYLTVLSEPGVYDARPWMPELREVMPRLDGIVYVPVESPDRVERSAITRRRLRRRVDEALRELLMEDSWAFAIPVVEVAGTPEQRAQQVAAYVSTLSDD